MIEALAVPILTKAVDFLFDEAKNIVAERRAARQNRVQVPASPDIPLLDKNKEAILN
jgi:hypothetical protein